MYTFAQFVEKKLQEQQAPPAQPAKPGTPAAPATAAKPGTPAAPATAAKPGTPATQQPPKMNPQQRTQLLATVNKAVTGVVDNALKQLKLT
jgi:hypothetical protein